MQKNRALSHKSTERKQVLHQWVDLAIKEHLRLGTLNSNCSWKPALQAVQKEAKIPNCFVKGDKLNQFLEEMFKLVVEKYGHLNTTTVKIPSPQEINNLMVKNKRSTDSSKGGPTPGSQQSDMDKSALQCEMITVERNFPPTATTASAPSLEYWKEEMVKKQGIFWQDNSNMYRRMWTKDTVTDLNYWYTVKPKYGFASPYSKVGAVEGRSIVVGSKDLKKEKVCERIFELGLKHISVWKVGEKNGMQH
ncbi:hypothetical protein QOT17_002000 [Balamuthia mandrillaris]